MDMRLARLSPLLRVVLPVLAGGVLAIVLYELWLLRTLYLVAIVLGIVLTCLSALFLRRMADFLMVAFLVAIPVTGFYKTLFLTSAGYDDRTGAILLYSGVIGVGLPDLLLAGLYLLWFGRVVVTRTAPLPRLQKPDVLVLLLVAAYVLSIPGSPDPRAGIFAVAYLLRYVLVYFYLSRNFHRRHIPWLLAAVAFTLIHQCGLAAVQYTTGRWVGIGMDRAAGAAVDFQYIVPGIEHRNRATGTAFESHTFGLYAAMLIQYMFVLLFTPRTAALVRTISAVLFFAGAVAVLVSFSRSAWLSCAGALAIVWCVHLMWGERQIVAPTVVVFGLFLVLSPWAISLVLERFTSAEGIVAARFEQYPVAWSIWRDHFIRGYGVGNYMEALKTYNIQGVIELPVHNVFLWLAAETGLIGVVAFFGILGGAIRRSWRIVRAHREPACRLALIVLAGLVAYFLDGLTDPLYREPMVYMMFWVSVGLSVALVRIDAEAKADADTDTDAERSRASASTPVRAAPPGGTDA